MSPLVLCASLLVLLAWHLSKSPTDTTPINVPTVTLGRFVPCFVDRLLFCAKGPALIYDGYKKYKNVPFRVRKVDTDLIVLPAKYLDEIRHLPHTRLSLLDAQFDSVCGDYTNILSDSFLPAHTVVKKLTPALGRIVPNVIDELKHAFDVEVPGCYDKWVTVTIYSMILKLINRSTSRIIVGDALCRREDWLNTVLDYTYNLGIIIFLLRPLPRFLRPLVAGLLPQVRHARKILDHVKTDIIVPMILERGQKEANDSNYRKPDDFMQWMMDTADNDYDKQPGNIAQGLMIIMALAVIHTSTITITQSLYDLLIRPEYVQPLRQEITDTLKHGWANATKADFATQVRLDSFLRESQRLNPTHEVNVQRIAKETLVFKDGFVVPKGTHICFAAGPLSRDPELIDDPETFDGFRWCKDRQYNKKGHNNSLVALSKLNLHFGYGRQACPGRFFAENTSKAILSRLLVEYDLKFPEGKEVRRPWNIRNGEQIVPNIYTKVLIRKRPVNL